MFLHMGASVKKSAAKSAATGRPFKKGERDPRQGRGPAKGAPNAGRPKLAFVEECHDLADTLVLEKCRDKLAEADPDDPAWRWAADYVSRYSKSPAKVAIEHDVGPRLEQILARSHGDDAG